MSGYVTFTIVNSTQQNGNSSGLSDSAVYLFLTQEALNTAWRIDPGTGMATSLPPGTLAPGITLADLAAAGGGIRFDAGVQVPSARLYVSSSPNAVSLSNSAISGPTAGTAEFFYDFVEFALTCTTAGAPADSAPNNLNIDTTQVDQLGIPITLQVTPKDPNFGAGSGVVLALDRQTLIDNFQAMAVGPLAPFADCVFPRGGNLSAPYRLLNPSHVIDSQLSATGLQGSMATSGSTGAWQATFTITGPGTTAPTNGSLAIGMPVSGPLIPAGTAVGSLPGFPSGSTVVMNSTAMVNPFTAISGVQLFFITPPTTALASYFDQAIDDFFAWYLKYPSTLLVEQNNGGDHTYTGNVVQVSGITDINGNGNTYTVLQFTGGNSEIYNLYYPFFSTNAGASKMTPFGAAVPPPPAWWVPRPPPVPSLAYYAPPSLMVFGASGVFADNAIQPPYAPNNSSAVQGAIENVIATALARGYATTWRFLQGFITPHSPPTTARVTLAAGSTTAGLVDQMNMASFQIANVPMTAAIPTDAPVSDFSVSSPRAISPTVADLLSFSQFYPRRGTWSAYANFLHDPAVTIDGRAYALPFDDQGGFSSDLNAATSVANPASASITLGPWTPRGGTPHPAVVGGKSITLMWPASAGYTFVFVLSYSAGGAYVSTSVTINGSASGFNGNTYALPVVLQTPTSVQPPETLNMKLVAVSGVYSGAVWCHINVPGFLFEGNAFEFSAQYDGAPPQTIW